MKSTRLVLGAAIAVSLAIPSLAFGQRAVGRTDPPTTSSGSGSSGSSSSGSSSSGESRTSGSSSGGESRVVLPSIPDSSRQPSRLPTIEQRKSGNSGSSSSSSTSAKGAAARGGSDNGSGAVSRGVGGSSSVVDPNLTRVAGGGSVRERGNRAVLGTAIERPLVASSPGVFINLFYNPWNNYYGGYYGYGYSRYGCGYACNWGYYDPFGFWYDPFYRYRYSGWYDDPYGYSSSRSRDEYETPARRMGSLRIKANVASAKIYIDGVLVGIVDDFDGLTDHLELEAGPHQMELRADGYEPLQLDVEVKSGRTSTERLKLKKKN